MTADRWFEVDRAGFAANLTDEDRSRSVLELVQNGWDADGVTRVDVTLRPADGRARWEIVVEDDAPDGFADLTHAWTLYAPSTKRADATKRGRFNEGEKKILSLCEHATVASTTGSVSFNTDGTRTLHRTKRPAGSAFVGRLRMTKPQGEAALRLLFQLIGPSGVTTTVNGEPLPSRSPVRAFEVSLPTVVAGEDGFEERTRRTTVSLFDPVGDEKPMIYEMGLPVVENGDRWHYQVAQRVPLNRDRDNVRPAYLRLLRTEVANHSHEMLTEEDARSTWVKEALADPRIEPEAVTAIVERRYGPKAVAFDPSDREANDLAAQHGYTVVHGGSMSRGEWETVRSAGLLPAAGQVTPSPKVTTGSDGKPPIPRENWTAGMRLVADYAARLGKELLGFVPVVEVVRAEFGEAWLAAYGGRRLLLNLTRLGHAWFDRPDQRRVDELLLHEFAHEAAANHYSEEFHDACCRLGAALRTVTITLDLQPTEETP